MNSVACEITIVCCSVHLEISDIYGIGKIHYIQKRLARYVTVHNIQDFCQEFVGPHTILQTGETPLRLSKTLY